MDSLWRKQTRKIRVGRAETETIGENEEERTHWDVIVIGAGIAGMTAALYLKRANKDVLVIEKGMPGGAINTASTVKNYPGVLTVTGPEFSMLLYDQMKDNNIEVLLHPESKIMQKNKQNILFKVSFPF